MIKRTIIIIVGAVQICTAFYLLFEIACINLFEGNNEAVDIYRWPLYYIDNRYIGNLYKGVAANGFGQIIGIRKHDNAYT